MSTTSYLDVSCLRILSSWSHIVTQRAVEIVQRAIDEDLKQNYPEAYKLYQNSLDYFMLALKCKTAIFSYDENGVNMNNF